MALAILSPGPSPSEVDIGFSTDEALDSIAVAAATPTTELSRVITIPDGTTIQRVTLLAVVNAMNDTANLQKVDIEVQGRLAGGTFTTFFSQDDVIGLPASDGVTTSLILQQDVTALVTAAGTFGFRLNIEQSAAFAVRYTTSFYLIVTVGS